MRPIFGGLFVIFALALGLLSCKQEAPSSPTQTPTSDSAAPATKPIQIPGIPAPSKDSDAWLKEAHQVFVMTPVGNGRTKASMTIAWTPAALLLQIQTDDATPVESSSQPWENDSVEIFLASSPGSDDRIQFVCIPGRTTDPAKPVWHIFDKRADPRPVVAPEMFMEKNGDGYAMRIAIPWANLKHIPQPGDVIGVQVSINDATEDGKITKRIWFPEVGADSDASLMQGLQLGGQADAPELAAAWIQPKGFGEAVQVSSTAEEVGKQVELWSSGKQVATSELKAGGPDGSSAEIEVTDDWAAQKGAPLLVIVDGQTLPAILKIPDVAKYRVALLKRLPLVADPSIFDSSTFPKIDFANKELVEATAGPYTLHVRYFDANWNEVTAPKAPGRYGAVVEFKSEAGLTFTKYLTLFKTAHPYVTAKDPYNSTIKFPTSFGLPSDITTKESWNLSDWSDRTFRDLAHQNGEWAILLAGLSDVAADPARWHGFTVWEIDDVWWAEIRKRLGENQDYPHLTYLPDGYDKDKKAWPLILFLHGSGQRGDDLNKLKNEGPLGYIHQGHPLPFIVVTPQCPADQWWDPSRLGRLLDQVASENRVDPKRIYVTGLSMGGFGSFDLAATYPNRIAAIAPLSGGDDPDLAERLKKMPAWIFHGDADMTVPPRYSVDLFHAMQKAGAPVKLTIYPGVGHGKWEVTYDDPELYAWLLQHSK